MASGIGPATHRDVFCEHDAVCSPCRDLFAFARQRDDRNALDAWRKQVTAHIGADHERREYEKSVARWLGDVAAYRRERDETEVV